MKLYEYIYEYIYRILEASKRLLAWPAGLQSPGDAAEKALCLLPSKGVRTQKILPSSNGTKGHISEHCECFPSLDHAGAYPETDWRCIYYII